jgi:hypothetical protein
LALTTLSVLSLPLQVKRASLPLRVALPELFLRNG